MTLSSGKSFDAPKPLKAALRRLNIRGRRVSRKIEAAKVKAGFAPKARLPKGTHLEVSNNRKKSSAALARLHARIANVRADFTHKLTTRLYRENQAVVNMRDTRRRYGRSAFRFDRERPDGGSFCPPLPKPSLAK